MTKTANKQGMKDIEDLVGKTIFTCADGTCSDLAATSSSQIRADEYSVFLPNTVKKGNKKSSSSTTSNGTTIGTITTTFGEVAYTSGGKQKNTADSLNLFRNDGDVFVAVDGVSTADKKAKDVKAMIQKSILTKEISNFRMRDIKYKEKTQPTQPVAVASPPSTITRGQLPGEFEKKAIEEEIRDLEDRIKSKEIQIEDIRKDVADLKKELDLKTSKINELNARDEQWLVNKLDEFKKSRSLFPFSLPLQF